MKDLNAAAAPAGEGLPFWAFWLLVSIILLLLFYIFLRDKDLRRRLSSFLSGTKRRMLRLRLQAKLKKERGKKAGLWKELGRTAWSEDLRAEGTAEIFGTLKVLDGDMNAAQASWHEAYSKIAALEKTAAVGAPDGGGTDGAAEARAREMQEWERKKAAAQERIVKIKKSSEPIYESLGRILDQTRPSHESLAMSYFQLDHVQKTIKDLLARIESLQ